MREIKFRCWIDYGPGHCTMLYDRGNLSEFFDAADGNPIMQYTGLKDKNGKEIYEGDIVYIAGYGNCVIEWPFLQLFTSSFENDVEHVIGNIYENPELLK